MRIPCEDQIALESGLFPSLIAMCHRDIRLLQFPFFSLRLLANQSPWLHYRAHLPAHGVPHIRDGYPIVPQPLNLSSELDQFQRAILTLVLKRVPRFPSEENHGNLLREVALSPLSYGQTCPYYL